MFCFPGDFVRYGCGFHSRVTAQHPALSELPGMLIVPGQTGGKTTLQPLRADRSLPRKIKLLDLFKIDSSNQRARQKIITIPHTDPPVARGAVIIPVNKQFLAIHDRAPAITEHRVGNSVLELIQKSTGRKKLPILAKIRKAEPNQLPDFVAIGLAA